MIKEYSTDLQKLFLEMMLCDAQNFVRVQNIYNHENFDRSLRPAAEFIKKHCNDHKTMPALEQINAVTGMKLQHVPDLNDDHFSWFMQEFESFTKRLELERAILKAADMLEKGEFDPVEKLIKDAVQISLTKDMGTDYFESPKSRLEKYFNSGGQVSTGWPSVDKLLYGGFSRGELNIFAGGSGAGKSLFLQNLALNWSFLGLNGVYFSLELSEGLCSMRMDSMLTGTSTREIYKQLEDVDLKVRMAGKKAGKLQIVQLPNGITVNDLKSWIKEFTIQQGARVDCVVIDYLDLMMPASQKISVSDMFVKDKLVAEELRNLVVTENLLLATASQLNRSAVESVEFDHSMIAGGLSKIQTADNVFGIYSTPSMKERGTVQIQFMKTRSSSGVGQKVELAFDVNTLAIGDLSEDVQNNGSTHADALYAGLKRQSMQGQGNPLPGLALKQAERENSSITSAVSNSEDLRRKLLKK